MARLRVLLATAGALVALAASGSSAAAAPSDGTLTGDGDCRLIPPLNTAQPVGTAPCPGVRPGALVESDVGLCTLNYLFQGSDGRRYIGTAGHCILETPTTGGDVGEQRWAPGEGPEARDGDGKRIGEFAYAVVQRSEEADFALIRLDEGVEASPQMCHFGGPTGLDTSNPDVTQPTVLNHFGNGILIGNLILANQNTLPARSALALGMPDDRHVFAEGVAAPGDSGSPADASTGGAIGLLVTVGVHAASIGTSGVDVGTVGILRLGPLVDRAEAFTGRSYTLQTAPLL